MSACRSALLVVLLLALAAGSFGQVQAPVRTTLPPPGLLVRPDPDRPELPLDIQALDVDIQITGELAVTTLDLTYANPNDRQLAGRFVLPLPRGASPHRFAMEVEGVLQEGAVVARERGRVVFETIVRENTDPGLLEWVKGNAFRARVFPIPARGTKRLVVGYEQELPPSHEGIQLYRLPLAYQRVVDRVRVAIHAQGRTFRVTEAPFPRPGGEPTSSLGPIELLSHRLGTDLVLELQDPGRVPFVKVARDRDGLYFLARVPATGEVRPREPAGNLAVLWDASRSRESSDRTKELAILERYLAAAAQEGPVQVRLVVFSNEVWFSEDLEVAGGDAQALRARIEKIMPDGGTRLGCLQRELLPEGCQEVLLFSDGLETLPRGTPDLGVPVYAICTATVADHARLAKLASQGAVVDASSGDVEAVISQLCSQRTQVLLVTGGTPDRVQDLELGPTPVVTGDRVLLAGRLRAEEPVPLTVWVGYPEAEPEKVTVELDPATATADPAVPRIWARKRIARLLGSQEENELEITRLARRYGIVTPFTSLIVLESLQDYIRFEVVPPPAMQEEYFQVIEARRKEAETTRTDRLAHLQELWTARVEWWESSFSLPPPGWKPPEEEPDESEGGGLRGGAMFGFSEDEERSGGVPAPSPAEGLEMGDEGDGDGGAFAPQGAPTEEAIAGEKKEKQAAPSGGITLKPWTPDQPYLQALQDAGDEAYSRYLALAGEYAGSPAFFLDVADLLGGQPGKRAEALRVLSNVAEMNLEDVRLLRVLAHRYRQLGELEAAAAVFEEVLRLRPEEPQSHRDLALVLAELGQYERAIGLLETVALGDWDDRFPEIELIALGEVNAIIERCRRETGKTYHMLPASLVRSLPVDIRVLLSWDADLCDMDLWVTEPTREKAFYNNRRTYIGGNVSSDFTSGYGPEEYLLKKAFDGTYRVQVNYFASAQQELTGPTVVQVEVIRNYGRPGEVRQSVTRRLATREEVLDIADIKVP